MQQDILERIQERVLVWSHYGGPLTNLECYLSPMQWAALGLGEQTASWFHTQAGPVALAPGANDFSELRARGVGGAFYATFHDTGVEVRGLSISDLLLDQHSLYPPPPASCTQHETPLLFSHIPPWWQTPSREEARLRSGSISIALTKLIPSPP